MSSYTQYRFWRVLSSGDNRFLAAVRGNDALTRGWGSVSALYLLHQRRRSPCSSFRIVVLIFLLLVLQTSVAEQWQRRRWQDVVRGNTWPGDGSPLTLPPTTTVSAHTAAPSRGATPVERWASPVADSGVLAGWHGVPGPWQAVLYPARPTPARWPLDGRAWVLVLASHPTWRPKSRHHDVEASLQDNRLCAGRRDRTRAGQDLCQCVIYADTHTRNPSKNSRCMKITP